MPNHKKTVSLLRPLLRGLPLIIGFMLICLYIAKKYLHYTTPQYESTVKIKLADTHEGVSNSNLFKDFDVFANTNKIGAEVELLKSKSLVSKIIPRLPLQTSVYRVGDIHKTELYNESPFIIRAALSTGKYFDRVFKVAVTNREQLEIIAPDGSTTHGTFGNLLKGSWGALLILKNDSLLAARPGLQVNDHYEFKIHSVDNQIAAVIKDLDVMAVDKDIPVLRISYKCPVAQKSADVVNALAAAYITDYIDEKFRSADTTAGFLDQQLQEYSRKLSASESSIEQFRTTNNIVNIPQETETDLRKIADLKKQLASVQMNLNAIDTLNNYMKQGQDHFLELAPNFEAFTDLLSTEMIKKTKDLQGEKRELLTRYTPQHEKVKIVEGKLNDISEYLQESISNTQKNLRIKYNDLQQTISQAEQVFVGLPTREKKLTIMERNFGLNDQIYRFLHEKRTEAEIAKAATISFHRIISPGDVPVKPVSPNSTIIKVMAIILGFFGGLALVYAAHFLKGRVDNEEVIQRTSDTPVMMAVPMMKKAGEQEQFFRRWATELTVKGLLPPGSVIVSSAHASGEGETYNASALAAAINRLGQNAYFIDVQQLDSVIMSQPQRWQAWLEQARREHEILIIRNVPIAQNPAALLVMAAASINLVVLDSRRTHRRRITDTDLLRDDLQLPALYFVLNRSGYNPSLVKQAIQWILKIKRTK